MNDNLHQDQWRGLPVFDAIGRKFHFTIREMRRVSPNRWMIVWDLLAVAILVLGNVHGYRDVLPVPLVAVLWTAMILTVTVFYLGILVLCIKISQRFSGFFIYFPIVGFMAMSITTFLNNFNYSLMTGEIYTFELASSHLLFNLTLGLLFETLFMIFVYPKVLADIGTEDVVEEKEAPSQSITIAGTTFAIDEIYSVSSQDHYVEVTTLKSSTLLRGRLADVIDRLSSVDGLMPHRSHWVARKAVVDMAGNASKKTLVLATGAEIPVARGRISEVRRWLEASEA